MTDSQTTRKSEPLPAAAIQWACGLTAAALPERQAYLPHPPKARRTENDQTAYAGVYHAFLSIDFWADILRPVLGETYRNERPLAFRADRLRQINGSYWGYSGSGGQNLVMSYNRPE